MLLINLSRDSSTLNPYISTTLLSAIEDTLGKNEKVILYLNKRGQFNSLVCKDCQHLKKCHQCDVSMSVHTYPSQLLCHLCGYAQNIPLSCEKCQGTHLENIGVGTQQIEDSLRKYLTSKKSEATLFRFDTDSMKTKSSKTEALSTLDTADIIIGTKMITTGFNFNNVGLIGVILLEQELQIPKYSTEESVYTNIRQLIGRGGRKGQKTQTILQSFIPENDVIQSIAYDNYKEFFTKILSERKLFGYPPYSECAILEYRHEDKDKALKFIRKFYEKITCALEESSYDITAINHKTSFKRHNQFYCKILLKGEKLRDFLEIFKKDILGNSQLSIIFE